MSESKEPPTTKPKGLLRSLLWTVISSRWVQGLLIALFVVVTLLSALYLSIVPLLNNWLPPLLDRVVAPGSQVHIRSLTRQQFSVDSIDLQPSPGVLLQLSNATLSYRGAGLLQGHADRLYAESVKVILSDVSANQTGSSSLPGNSQINAQINSEPLSVSLPLMNDLMSLPVNEIVLDTLAIETPEISAQLSANVTPDHWLFTGTARLPHIPGAIDVHLQLQRNESERSDLLMMLSQQEVLLAQLWAVIEQQQEQSSVQLRLESDLEALQSSLPDLAALPVKLQRIIVDGSLTSANESEWPAGLTTDLNATLQVNPSTLGDGLTLQATGLKARLQHVASQTENSVSKSDDRWHLNVDLQKIVSAIDLPDVGRWRASMPAQSLTASCNNLITECSASSDLKAVLKGMTNAELALAPNIQWQQNGSSTLTLPVNILYQQDTQDGLPGWALKSNGQLLANLNVQGDWQLTSTEGLVTTINADPYEGWKSSPIKGVLFNDLALSGNINDTRLLHTTPVKVSLSPLTLHSSEGKLSFAPSRISCDPGEINTNDLTNGLLGNCSVSLRLNDSKWGLWPVPDVSLFGPISFTMDDIRERVTASLELKAANSQIHFRTRFEHDLMNNIGSLQWHLLDAQLDWFALGMSDMENLTSTQLLNGQMSGQGWIDWELINAATPNETWQIIPDIMLRADGLGAVYDNSLTLEDWNAMLALRRPASNGQLGDYVLDAQISGSKLNSGIPLKNLLARSQTRIPADFSYFDLAIHEIHMDLLGGRVYAPLINYDSRKDINSFGIRLDHLQLSQIAAIEEGAGISASGLLDGMLPIILTKDGPMVPGGNLFARDPGGVIKYQDESADALAQADQSVGMAMKLLQNFQYDQLQSGVLYQPDGKLDLALQFEGKNPDFFGGQATHLNVNLEYNLLDLLESLRVANDVIEQVEAKYK